MASRSDDGAAWGLPGPCPECGGAPLRAVRAGHETNFLCASCGACWFYSMGWLGRVDPATCPGCSHEQRRECLAQVVTPAADRAAHRIG